MAHPDIRLDVDAAAVLEVHGYERAGHDVVAVLGKDHARPFLPLRARARDRQRAWRQGEELAAEPLVRAQPGVVREAVGAAPARVAVQPDERVALLPGGAH